VWLGTFVPGVFHWTIASGISPWSSLVQIADVVGERGVTALIAISCALLADAARARSVQTALISLGIPAAMCISGAFRISSVSAAREHAPKIRVALIQPSTEARMRWDPNEADAIVRRLTRLTIVAEQRGTDLVVWPEAAFPYVMASNAKVDLYGNFAVLQPGVRGPVLTGLLMRAPRDAYGDASFNSAALVHGNHVDAPYHKMHLLAFGEAVPFAGTFPFLRKIFVRGTGLVAGDRQVAMTVPFAGGTARIAVLDCFEDTLPEAGVEAASVDPNLLVNVTNDAWFVETHESELHARLAAMRAIELRKDFVRSVNLGVTSFIDATGRIRARYDLPIAGSLPTTPALLEGKTIFARLGDFSGALLLGLFSLATWAGTKRKRRALVSE
jgi:apolipoprotein N-acyltransferase